MSLYSPSERPPNSLGRVANMNDGSGTINPAALTGHGTNGTHQPTSRASIQPSPPTTHHHVNGYDHYDRNHSRSRDRMPPPLSPVQNLMESELLLT